MGRPKENLVSRISLLIYPEWRARLEDMSRRRGGTLSGLLRQIIAQALDEDDAGACPRGNGGATNAELISCAWATDYTGATRLVLLALASLADRAGECEPSLADIARQAGCSQRQVCNSLNRLIADGVVTKMATGGGRASNRYRLNLNGGPGH